MSSMPDFAGAAARSAQSSSRRTSHRRSVESGIDCYEANSTAVNEACNCFGIPRHPLYETRPTVIIAVGGWPAGEVDSWLLKIVIEEVLGFPTELVSDGLSNPSSLNLTGPNSVWNAMANGLVHMYPEVRSCHVHTSLLG